LQSPQATLIHLPEPVFNITCWFSELPIRQNPASVCNSFAMFGQSTTKVVTVSQCSGKKNQPKSTQINPNQPKINPKSTHPKNQNQPKSTQINPNQPKSTQNQPKINPPISKSTQINPNQPKSTQNQPSRYFSFTFQCGRAMFGPTVHDLCQSANIGVESAAKTKSKSVRLGSLRFYATIPMQTFMHIGYREGPCRLREAPDIHATQSNSYRTPIQHDPYSHNSYSTYMFNFCRPACYL